MRKSYQMVIILLGCSCFLISCDVRFEEKKVHTVSKDIPMLPEIKIQSHSKFLNDLKLSPLWKVEKEREGEYCAYARTLSSSDPFLEPNPNQFLFEFMLTEKPLLPDNYVVHNKYVGRKGSFNSLSAKIVFQKPSESAITIIEGKGEVNLCIYDLFGNTIGPNSDSNLAIKIDKQQEIYLVLREQGNDIHRKATFEYLSKVLTHIKEISELPTQYHTEEYYRKFYTLFFADSQQETDIQRFPGIQGRDTYYGYFKSKKDLSYEGVNIKISHPVYCDGECTRSSSRLSKAEYMGIPFYENDRLFFLIEDNATYVLAEYNKDYGHFSGSSSFEGKLEILNNEEIVFYEGKDKFTGWER